MACKAELVGDFKHELDAILRDDSPATDLRWRRLFAEHLELGPTRRVIESIWESVLDFDPVLRAHLEEPIQTDGPAVLVAGSGKESLKTFNVSTAAAILAASAGARIVKGVSTSVSATSGSADILNCLGISACSQPTAIPPQLARFGIAFTPYSIFCPQYATRYDRVFGQLSPASFFMPVAVLAVAGQAYVYGIADRRVTQAAEAIAVTRPDLSYGQVVATQPSRGSWVDEYTPHGCAHLAEVTPTGISHRMERHRRGGRRWRRAIAHRKTHCENAALVTAALQPGPGNAVRDLVEHNAALIMRAHQEFSISIDRARQIVSTARQDGEAARFLKSLKSPPTLAVTPCP